MDPLNLLTHYIKLGIEGLNVRTGTQSDQIIFLYRLQVHQLVVRGKVEQMHPREVGQVDPLAGVAHEIFKTWSLSTVQDEGELLV